MATTNNIDNEVIKRIVDYTDGVNECDCCGKQDLKGTYVVTFNDEVTYLGSVCAFKIHGVTFDEQKNIKKTYKAKIKSADKLKQMEESYPKTAYHVSKMLKFVESKKLDVMAFILKYGKLMEETNFYYAYQVGNHVKMINK